MPSKIVSKREQVTNEIKRIILMRGHNKFTRQEIQYFISDFSFEFAVSVQMATGIFDLAEKVGKIEIVPTPYAKPKRDERKDEEDVEAVLLAKPEKKEG